MLGFAIVMSPIADLRATELKILAGSSMTGSLNELGPQFERASGHKLTIHFDSTPNLIKQATSGEPFDLAVAPVDVFATLPQGPLRPRQYLIGVSAMGSSSVPAFPNPTSARQMRWEADAAPRNPYHCQRAAGAYVLSCLASRHQRRMKAKTSCNRSSPDRLRQSPGEADLGIFLSALIAPVSNWWAHSPRLRGLVFGGVAADSRPPVGRNGLHQPSDDARRRCRYQGQRHEPRLNGPHLAPDDNTGLAPLSGNEAP
jgi:molybdate transport system substrate-binding protein